MKIAYLVNQYPKVSHSFIRREILSLERSGVEVSRYSIRSLLGELVDSEDVSEHSKTKFFFTRALPINLIIALVRSLLKPKQFFSALLLAFRCGWKSEAGTFKHIVYFLEACVLANWSMKDNIQHIHAHFGTNSATLAMLTSILADTPYSFTVHGPEEFDKPEFISMKKKIELSSFVVAISSFGKSQLYRQLDAKNWGKVNIVHCGLEEDFYSGEIQKLPDSFNLVCVGRLCEQKGQLILVEAVKYLVEAGLDFHLTLVGDGPMRQDVEYLIEKYDLSDYIDITGWMSSKEVRKVIESSKVSVLPSFAEGLPVVIMESMALARPVISTYIAGIPELLIHGENGWLVPAGDVQALVDVIKEVVGKTTEELEVLGLNAKKRVIDRHSIDFETAKLAALFETSIASTRRYEN